MLHFVNTCRGQVNLDFIVGLEQNRKEILMTAGIPGTGPYCKLRSLQVEVKDYKYELGLVRQGMKRRFAESTLLKKIADIRAKIREIHAEIKEKKKTP